MSHINNDTLNSTLEKVKALVNDLKDQTGIHFRAVGFKSPYDKTRYFEIKVIDAEAATSDEHEGSFDFTLYFPKGKFSYLATNKYYFDGELWFSNDEGILLDRMCILNGPIMALIEEFHHAFTSPKAKKPVHKVDSYYTNIKTWINNCKDAACDAVLACGKPYAIAPNPGTAARILDNWSELGLDFKGSPYIRVKGDGIDYPYCTPDIGL